MNEQEPTYLFYDFETSGRHSVFDQVLQYAYVRTDLSFQVIEEDTGYIKCSKGTCIHPEAQAVHGIDGLTLLTQGISEHLFWPEFAKALHTPQTRSIGYNSLNFDDLFVRFGLFKHGLDPYWHHYGSGCVRMDVFPVMLMAYLYAPGTINWPMIEEGVVLKLERLNQENNWLQGRAHDALFDVHVTIEAAKALSQSQRFWDWCVLFFNKRHEQSWITKVKDEGVKTHGIPVAWAISTFFGRSDCFHAPVLWLGVHQVYGYDMWLRLDRLLDEDVHFEDGCVLSKKFGQMPWFMPWHKPPGHVTENLGAFEQNKVWLASHQKWLDALREKATTFLYPDYAHLDPWATLYTQMPNQQERVAWASFLSSKEIPSEVLDRTRIMMLRYLWRYEGVSDGSILMEDLAYWNQYQDHQGMTRIE